MFRHGDILLRVIEPADLEVLREARNDPSTWSNLTDISLITEAEQRRWYETLEQRGRKYFMACEPKYQGPIGLVRMDEIDWTNRSIRVGCDVFPHLRGNGYGSATFAAILKYAFDYLNMHRVWLAVIETNRVARHVYLKHGLREEGRYREAIFRDGRYVDYLVMSILEDEYRRCAQIAVSGGANQ